MTKAPRALQIAARMPRNRLATAVGTTTDTDLLHRSPEDAAALGLKLEPVVSRAQRELTLSDSHHLKTV